MLGYSSTTKACKADQQNIPSHLTPGRRTRSTQYKYCADNMSTHDILTTGGLFTNRGLSSGWNSEEMHLEFVQRNNQLFLMYDFIEILNLFMFFLFYIIHAVSEY